MWWAIAGAFVAGGLVVAALLNGTNIAAAEMFTAKTSMQGWAGAFIGSMFAAAVAWFVLRSTLRAEAVRVAEQSADAKEALETQLAEARENLERQQADSRRLMGEQAAADRDLAQHQRRIEAWAEFMATLRRFFQTPLDRPAFSNLVQDATAAYFRWSLYLASDEIALREGADFALGQVIIDARNSVFITRRENLTIDEADHKADSAYPKNPVMLVNLVKHGNSLHSDRTEDERAAATKWFTEMAEARPPRD